MIEFFPRDIEMWRKSFTFSNPLTTSKTFYDRIEFMRFCKEHGVKFDDPSNPLQFLGPREHHNLGWVYEVKQFSCLGWMKEYPN